MYTALDDNLPTWGKNDTSANPERVVWNNWSWLYLSLYNK